MGLDPRQSLELWEEVFDELREHPMTPRRERIARKARRVDNGVALARLVLQTGASDAEMEAFARHREAARKREIRRSGVPERAA